MVPGQDPIGGPTSFTARRPNASNLHIYELPPPPTTFPPNKYQPFSHINSTQATATTLTSVGNLLTPPSNGSADGISPNSTGVTSGSSHASVAPFTPAGSGGMWPPPTTASNSYGFQTASAQHQPYGQGRSLFSPSLNTSVRGTSSPTTSEAHHAPSYEVPPPYGPASMSMSAPSLPALPHHPHQMIMGGQTPVTHASPVSTQDAFTRPPPTPTYYSASAPPSANPNHGAYPYSAGPSPIAQSPISAGGAPKMSPVNGHGPIPSPQQPAYQRPYTYPLPGAVLTNVNNPSGHMQMVGGIPHGMVPGFNSGHAAQMQQLYGHHPQPSTAPTDRPFRCDQCPQSFNRNHDLKRHKRIHLAVKPFPCGHCDKSFSRKDALKRHILVKGCGKAHATAEVKKLDGSSSPERKVESVEASPIIAASA